MPKVSVLMPVYKTNETHLREAIESVLNQEYADFEFLILDDGQLEDREQIIRSYKDKRIKYFKNKTNMGISQSRNKLIELARGEYLSVMDHDDIALPKLLLRQVQYLDSHPDVGVVGVKCKTLIKQKASKYPSNDHDIKLALMHSCAISHSSAMIRKSVLVQNGVCYEEEFSPAEDYALWCRLISRTAFHNLNNEVLFYYRDHKNNVTHKQSDKMYRAALALWALNQTVNTRLYNEFLLRAHTTTRLRLFGVIPFVTIKKKANKTKIYLFEKILVFTKKTNIKLQEE